ncbi:hypothetical protein COO60DRAFT_830887 [Scenedesmus sp. NREL 46B-D3]|nr:hypothetical protein COO60DRAFT_830887 [Scenedesmus sp. NREL 46B-D3]
MLQPAAGDSSSCGASWILQRCSCCAAVQRLPRHMQGPGGQLHAALRNWLLGSSSGSSAGDAGSSDAWLEAGVESSHAWLEAGADSLWKQYHSSSSSRSRGQEVAVDAASSQQQQQWHARPQDYLSWRTSCDSWLRVLLCCRYELPDQLMAAVSSLETMVEQLTSRSYLAAGAAERTFVMLQVLLEGAEEAGRVAVEAGQPLPMLTMCAAEMAAHVAGRLGRCVELYSSCYQSSPAVLAWGEGSSSSSREVAAGAAGAGVFGLCPAAWAAAARAEAAAQAAAAAAVLLARCAGGCWATCGALDSQEVTGTAAAAAAAAAGVVPGSKRSLPALLKLRA